MENVILQVLVFVFSGFSAALWGHYWITKRSKEKEFVELRDKVLKLEQTSVREHNVKELVENSISPIYKGITELKELLGTMQKDVTDIKLNEARREGAEAALAAQKEKR
jgi:hypothetical protein